MGVLKTWTGTEWEEVGVGATDLVGVLPAMQQAFALLGGDMTHADDFHGPDGPLGYRVTPTGGLWSGGSGERLALRISDNLLVPDPDLNVSGQAHIDYLLHSSRLDALAMCFMFLTDADAGHTAQSASHANAVMGAAVSGFGAGSIQLGMYQGGFWQLFAVPIPISGAYPTIASGPLAPFATGVPYMVAMRKIDSHTIKILLPDGQVATAVDDENEYIHTLWPRSSALKAGIQMRRQHAGDGTVAFCGFATGGDALNDRLAAQLVLVGDNGTRIYTAKPARWTGQYLDVKIRWAPGGFDPTAGVSEVWWVQESATGDHSWRTGRSSDNLPFLRLYYDGKTATNIKATDVPPAGTDMVNITRDPVTGDVKFWTSDDAGATWTQLGATRPSTPGDLWSSPAPLRFGSAGSIGMTGTLRSASLSDDVDTIASLDFSLVWPHRWADPQGNRWSLMGAGFQWETTAEVLPGPPGPAPILLTPGTIIATDAFSGGDVANINGRTLDNVNGGTETLTWAQVIGTTNGLSIVSGQLQRQSTGSSRRYNIAAGVADVYAALRVVTKPTTGSLFVAVRSDPAEAPSADYYYALRISGTLALVKRLNGAVTVLDSKTYTAGDTVSLRLIGSALVAAINDVVVMEVEDTDIDSTRTGVGLAMDSTTTGGQYDDYVIAAPS